MARQFKHGYALLIAVDQNAVPSAALPDVAKDVAALHDVLVHPERCGYTAENVRTLTGAQSTRDGIMAGLDWLREKLAADTAGNATALIYYSGHGHVEAGSYYLIPYDLNLNRIKTSSIRAEDFAAEIAGLKPRRLFAALDCCHAAGMEVKDLAGTTGLHSAALPPGLFMQEEKAVVDTANAKALEALGQGAGRAVLSSSQADEKSWVRQDGKMSIFTYHLIEALTGHAQPQAGAAEVLVSDVMSHVHRRVPASAQADHQAPQHPQFQVSGNFPLALLLGGKGLPAGGTAPDPLSLPPAAAGQQATLTGSGAIAQGAGAVAVGRGGVFVGGGNIGNINTGTQIRGDFVRGDKVLGDKIGSQINTGGGAYVGGNVSAGRDFVGRDKTVHGDQITTGDVSGTGIAIGRGAQANVTQGISPRDLELLFAPLLAAVAREAPADKTAEAVQQVRALKAEVAKGKQADDGKIAKLVDGLVGLVPNAVGTVVSTFASPILGGIAGPVTKFVLDKLQGR